VKTALDQYRFHASSPWTSAARAQLADVLSRAGSTPAQPLGGRTSVVRIDLDGVGPVVVKRYGRGGVLRHLVTDRYIRWGPSRSEVEFGVLSEVRRRGVQAPEPLAHLDRGWLWYRAWLVTREIPAHRSLAELAVSDEDRVRARLDDVVAQITRLIAERYLHVDLHPGNVVLDSRDEVYLIDFDRAHRFGGTRNQLRDRYLHRWRRAVIKHGLPDYLSEQVCLGLRRSFDEGDLREGIP